MGHYCPKIALNWFTDTRAAAQPAVPRGLALVENLSGLLQKLRSSIFHGGYAVAILLDKLQDGAELQRGAKEDG